MSYPFWFPSLCIIFAFMAFHLVTLKFYQNLHCSFLSYIFMWRSFPLFSCLLMCHRWQLRSAIKFFLLYLLFYVQKQYEIDFCDLNYDLHLTDLNHQMRKLIQRTETEMKVVILTRYLFWLIFGVWLPTGKDIE